MWQPRDFITRQPTDVADFQLLGHRHVRGRRFTIDLVSDGACSGDGALGGRDDDMCNMFGYFVEQKDLQLIQ